MKKYISVILLLSLLCTLFSGCGSKKDATDKKTDKDKATSSVVSQAPQFVVNPLTGLENLSPDKANVRPVAVMVNNLTTAQKVQTGLDKADIVYETYVEAGITRLLAVYKDVASVGQIGTIRSARYSYVDLANGHDALYVHAGIDGAYCEPYANKVSDHINLIAGAPSASYFREKNGLSKEHTLYSTGEKILSAMGSMKRRTTVKEAYNTPWVSFNSAESPATPTNKLADGTLVKTVTVPMSGSYTTQFIYDETAKEYYRTRKGTAHTDYKTGSKVSVKNIFVLFTTVTPFPDNYHVKEHLDSGSGYYVSDGGYEEIQWKKGATSDKFVFTKADGSVLNVNAGQSWVFIANQNIKSGVKFQ
ncbi:MAG: DUF3048 domain-containing protein [Clostridia bacterium]|nr:DUF3048 domain-containing protein [Clostridia bacterium]